MNNALPGGAAAWQAALAAEQQADFGYPVLGPQLPAAEQELARACAAAHDALVRRISALLAADGQPPVAPAADYPTVYPAGTAAAARSVAVRLEQDCAAAWRFVYAGVAASSAASDAATARRGEAQDALTASAVRATQWRMRSGAARATVAFPGIV